MVSLSGGGGVMGLTVTSTPGGAVTVGVTCCGTGCQSEAQPAAQRQLSARPGDQHHFARAIGRFPNDFKPAEANLLFYQVIPSERSQHIRRAEEVETIDDFRIGAEAEADDVPRFPRLVDEEFPERRAVERSRAGGKSSAWSARSRRCGRRGSPGRRRTAPRSAAARGLRAGASRSARWGCRPSTR